MPKNNNNSRKLEIISTVCNMCTNHCGINLHVENGRILNVEGNPEHPFHRLCPKPAAIPEFVHHRDRITEPQKRENNKFKKISWDEAFDFISTRLEKLKSDYGPQSLNIHTGNPFIATQTEKVIRRFADLFGTPNYTSGGGYCFLAKVIGTALTVGGLIAPYIPYGSKCMMVWGKNPAETFASEIDNINSNLRNGSKLIVIDPRKTSLAKKADIHAPIRPGTDGALSLGLLNVIIQEELYDKNFVKQWTTGFPELTEIVKDFPPDKVEEITWVPAHIIIKIAKMYSSVKPACISMGVSMDHHSNGIQAIRAISTLIAITGNLEVEGGNILSNPGVAQKNLRFPEKVEDKKSVGTEFPIFTKFSGETHVIPVINAMLKETPYPIKGFMCVGCNPAVTWPNTRKVKKAFKNLDFFAVIDLFMTPTARMADIVLPGTTPYEREDLRDAYHTHEAISLFLKTNKAIEPVGNSMTDWKIWAELGKKMGYRKYFPWKSTAELMEYLLEPTSFSLKDVEQNPGGIIYHPKTYTRYLETGFNTPSKKVEIFSEQLRDLGFSPLPVYKEPIESPINKPELAQKYPLFFTTGARSRAYVHSELRNIRRLRRLSPDPLVDIHPDTASKYQIIDGEWIKVVSDRGTIKIKANITEDIQKNVLSIPMGWNQANANVLTDHDNQDPISGFPELRAGLCRIYQDRP